MSSRFLRCLITFLAILCVTLSTSCVPAASSPASAASGKWTTGFWLWNSYGSDPTTTSPHDPPDVLYVHVGAIQSGGNTSGQLPQDPPAAKQYWLVFRYERQGVPPARTVQQLKEAAGEVWGQAKVRGITPAGIQLDIDSPTASLPNYAKFLAAVRPILPAAQCKLSITALLDWFHSGTSISEVIAQVDEFVPQFYDTGRPDRMEPAIAERIDAEKWGPVFNRYKKPFRIGISTFGRARWVRDRGPEAFYGDLSPLDLATNPAFEMQSSRNAAGELVLSYRATRKAGIEYREFARGEVIEFILPTPDSVRSAVSAARRMGGQVSGAVFFRWPSSDREYLAMQPQEALSAAAVPNASSLQPAIRTVDGGCAAVQCVDLYLEGATPYAAAVSRYRIRSSTPLDYFLPEKRMPVRMTGTSELELALPPYCGRARLLLGSAVSQKRAEYTLVLQREQPKP